jgi:2,5-diamino-6-(ribosylamino)-4(3H)-pyrimidinone 5'-phosphate reductase
MNRPYVLVNVAMSADGKIDSVARRGAAISSPEDKERVDRLRAESDAVLVGGRTLIDEDPKLTVKSPRLRAERRLHGKEENPAKVGIASHADLKPAGDFLTAGPARRLIYTTHKTPARKLKQLEKAGAEIFLLDGEVIDLREVMQSLYALGIRKLMVEGGGTLIAELIRLGLVDELNAYIAPRLFGGASAPTLADGPGFSPEQAPNLELKSVKKFDEAGGILVRYTIQH